MLLRHCFTCTRFRKTVEDVSLFQFGLGFSTFFFSPYKMVWLIPSCCRRSLLQRKLSMCRRLYATNADDSSCLLMLNANGFVGRGLFCKNNWIGFSICWPNNSFYQSAFSHMHLDVDTFCVWNLVCLHKVHIVPSIYQH